MRNMPADLEPTANQPQGSSSIQPNISAGAPPPAQGIQPVQEVPPTAIPMEQSKKGRSVIWLLVIIVVVVILGAVVFLAANPNLLGNQTQETATPTPTVEVTATTEPDGTDTNAGPVSEIVAGHKVSNEIMLFYTDPLGETTGDPVGCGDTLVGVAEPLSAETDTPIKTALEKLLALEMEQYFEPPVTNSLTLSNVTVDSVMLDGKTAVVTLSGTLISAGECADPRIEAQIVNTITQFDWVDKAKVTINGTPLESHFDLSG